MEDKKDQFRLARAKKALAEADFNKHAYVVIKADIDFDDILFTYEYVNIGENINDYIVCLPNSNKQVDEVYNLSLDIDMQLSERRSFHIEKYEKVKEVPDSLEKRALEFATIKHKGQYRKGSKQIEYINHPIEVCNIVSEYFKDSPDLSILKSVAYLHDTLEDTKTTFDELLENFGIKVAYLVKEVTNEELIKKDLGKPKYLAYKLLGLTETALNIKLCDRLANVRSLDNVDLDFLEKYTNETLYILEVLQKNRQLSLIQKSIIVEIYRVINTRILAKNKMLKL